MCLRPRIWRTSRALADTSWLAIERCQQDMRDGMQHGFRSAFQQVGEAGVDLSVAQSNGVVDGDKRIKPDVHRRRRRARAQFAIRFTKTFVEFCRHLEGRVARRCNGRLNSGGLTSAAFFSSYTPRPRM